jgi:hypothetical protein
MRFNDFRRATKAVLTGGAGGGPVDDVGRLHRGVWTRRRVVTGLVVAWAGASTTPPRRHSVLGYLSSIDHEALHISAETAT